MQLLSVGDRSRRKPATHTAAHLDTRTLSALLQAIALRSPGTQGLQSVDDPAVQPLLTADDFDHTRWVGRMGCSGGSWHAVPHVRTDSIIVTFAPALLASFTNSPLALPSHLIMSRQPQLHPQAKPLPQPRAASVLWTQ